MVTCQEGESLRPVELGQSHMVSWSVPAPPRLLSLPYCNAYTVLFGCCLIWPLVDV